MTDDGFHLCRGEPGHGWKLVGREPDPAGFRHFRRADDTDHHPRPGSRSQRTPSPPAVTPDWDRRAREYAEKLRPDHLAELASRLRLSPEAGSLYTMLGTSGVRNSEVPGVRTIFTVPEFDAQGRITGITERFPPPPGKPKEQQQMIAGGHRGLMLPVGWRDQPGPLFIVEGASDALAARVAGLAAVGRPGADGGAKLLAELLADWPADRDIVVLAERDPSGAGERGSAKLAQALARVLSRPVWLSFPPERAKDTRAWLTDPERDGVAWPDRGEQFSQRVMAAAKPVEHGTPASRSAAITPAPAASSAVGYATILVSFNERAVNNEAVQALAADPEIYQRAESLVRPIETPASRATGLDLPAGVRIVRVEKATLRERLAGLIRFQEEVGDDEKGYLRDVRPPHWCVDAVHARGHWPGIRNLSAVVDHPVVKPDGSVLSEPGYDADTELFLSASRLAVEVPADPGQDEARAAVELLLEAVCDVPFAEKTHQAAWVAALLTPLARFAFDGSTPLFLVDANVPGAGKGLICNLASVIITGGRLAVASYAHDPDEMEKRITAAAVSGDRLILLDNISGPFGNEAMDKALTGTVWRGRILGESREVKLPLWLTWYATGNNVELRGDIGRRIIHVRLNSLEERPDERADLRHPNLLEWAAENRPRLLGAALTILAAYLRAGCPSQGLKPMGSFDGWSRVVRSAVVWAGLADPADGRAHLRTEADPEVAAMTTVLREWENVVPDEKEGKPITAAELANHVFTELPPANSAEFIEAISSIVKERTAYAIGRKFSKFAGRNLGGLILNKTAAAKGVVKWFVSPADGTPPGRDVGTGRDVFPQSSKRSRVDTGSLWAETSLPVPTSLPGNEPPAAATPAVEAILAEAMARYDSESTRNLADDVRRHYPESTDRALDVLNAARDHAIRAGSPPD